MHPQTTQARQDVEALATHAGREVRAPGHADARRWLLDRLSGLKLLPYSGESFELPYTMGGTDFCNVMARLPGRRGASGGAPRRAAATINQMAWEPFAQGAEILGSFPGDPEANPANFVGSVQVGCAPCTNGKKNTLKKKL